MYHGGKYKDLLYRPGVDESRYETLPYDPSQPSRYETMPYRPEAEDPRRSEAAAELLGQAFLEQFLQQNPEVMELAGYSFEVPVDIDSRAVDEDIRRYRQSPEYKPMDMNQFNQNLQRLRGVLRGI